MHHYIPFSCDENSKYGNFEFQGPSHNSAPWPCLCEIECMPANVTKWSVCDRGFHVRLCTHVCVCGSVFSGSQLLLKLLSFPLGEVPQFWSSV